MLARRPGFTLIELLVVLAVIGTLVALLLPAIQAARAAAQRARCSSNLRQIGIALAAYHEAHGKFPYGCQEYRTAAANRHQKQLAWSACVLPYLEQQGLWQRLDLKKAYDDPANAAAAGEVLAVYLCPSIPHRDFRSAGGRGLCDYAGINGERVAWPGRPNFKVRNSPEKGILIHDTPLPRLGKPRPVSLPMITDGASQTLIAAEDSKGAIDGEWINGRNVMDQAQRINAATENDISSEHAGGANVVFADGHVAFLAEEMDLEPLAALCTRAGRENVHPQ